MTKRDRLTPAEFAALRIIAVQIARLSDARVDAAELVMVQGQSYTDAAASREVSPQAVWSTVARMWQLMALYRLAKAQERPSRSTAKKRPATR